MSIKEVACFGGPASVQQSEQFKNFQKALIGWKIPAPKTTLVFGHVNKPIDTLDKKHSFYAKYFNINPKF